MKERRKEKKRKQKNKTKEQQQQKENKQKRKDRKEQGRERSYSERVKAKWFCCEFKLGFIQKICKDSIISKSNLELALSIILKQRELNESKHVAVECRCLKIWDLLSFLICSSLVIFISLMTKISSLVMSSSHITTH